MPGAAAWGAGVWQGPEWSSLHQGIPLPSQGCDEDVLWRWGMCQMWGWLAADGTAAEAGVVSSMNGLSCVQVRGKDCCPWKLSPIAIKIWGGGWSCVFCMSFSHRSGKALAKSGVAKVLCCALVLAGDHGWVKEGFFMLAKWQPFWISLSTWGWASLPELMLHLQLCELSLNEEVQLPALPGQHFTYFRHNGRCGFESMTKQSSQKLHLQYDQLQSLPRVMHLWYV